MPSTNVQRVDIFYTVYLYTTITRKHSHGLTEQDAHPCLLGLFSQGGDTKGLTFNVNIKFKSILRTHKCNLLSSVTLTMQHLATLQRTRMIFGTQLYAALNLVDIVTLHCPPNSDHHC